jgi:hypothetical protein
MIKVRASALGRAMTNGRGKNAGMGETAKTFARELWIKQKYNREPFVMTKEMRKGIECEEASLSLYTKVTNQIVTKNEHHFNNEWLTGTPDILLKDEVVDIKTSWDIFTFHNAIDIKQYEWQLRAYMMLCNKSKATIAYCLVNNPPQQVSDELYRLQFKFDGGEENPEYERAANRLEKLMQYDDIHPTERVKFFSIWRETEKEDLIKARVLEINEYIKTL